MSGDVFIATAGRCYRHQRVEARDSAKHPAVHKTATAQASSPVSAVLGAGEGGGGGEWGSETSSMLQPLFSLASLAPVRDLALRPSGSVPQASGLAGQPLMMASLPQLSLKRRESGHVDLELRNWFANRWTVAIKGLEI